MDEKLISALLAMDSYNRGYSAGLDFNVYNEDGEIISIPTHIGDARIISDSTILGTTQISGEEIDVHETIGFYAIAYNYKGETIISFRGTDNQPTLSNPLPDDVFHGWPLGAGNIDSEQAQMAVRFYQAVAGDGNWRTADISLTGHSLGGGLAGFIGGLYDQDALLFDSMGYTQALLSVGNAVSDPFDAAYNPDVKQLIYGAETPWARDVAGIEAIHIQGEALGFIRLTDSTPLELGTSVDIFPASSNPVTDAVARGMTTAACASVRSRAGSR